MHAYRWEFENELRRLECGSDIIRYILAISVLRAIVAVTGHPLASAAVFVHLTFWRSCYVLL